MIYLTTMGTDQRAVPTVIIGLASDESRQESSGNLVPQHSACLHDLASSANLPIDRLSRIVFPYYLLLAFITF
ncbi:hypothetical protein PsYK624_043260 [Phanerochaete sordida]|uniref:Uncharacterized protein n=1 Tax=Phanerochaete sordida TaxID=48140 RepID=A0A9P3LBM6_9APHY|nr:hypothetical protein PsYK624_043260 [Phanerochaete sordida]